MKLPALRRVSSSHLALALACVFGVSWLASAQLGGSDGVMIPYQGRLELDGIPLEGDQSMTFRVFDVATNGTACWTDTQTVTTAAGHFGVVLGPVTEGCLLDSALYLEVEIDGVVLGRQRVHGAPIAHTAGPGGDFDVAGTLFAAVADLGSFVANSGTVANALNVNGTATVNTANATTLNVSGTATVGALDVNGTLTWECPAGTAALGAKCITDSQGQAASFGDALEGCHDQGMDLCPLETILLCDQLNQPSTGNQCGTVTDRAWSSQSPLNNVILTGTPWTSDFDGSTSAFARGTAFAQSYAAFPGTNLAFPLGSSGHYYCCTPISR